MSDGLSAHLGSRRLTLRRASRVPIADPRPLRPASLGNYGEEFDQATLDGRWASSGTLGSALALAGNSWATVGLNGVAYVYLPAPSGDFTVTAQIQQPDGVATNLMGLMVLDGSGNGVGLGPYNSPDQWLFTTISAGAYGGSLTQVGSDVGQPAQVYGAMGWYKIIKSGTTYTAQVGNRAGTAWSATSASWTGPSTATRIAVGRFQSLAGASNMRIDWIAVTQ